MLISLVIQHIFLEFCSRCRSLYLIQKIKKMNKRPLPSGCPQSQTRQIYTQSSLEV